MRRWTVADLADFPEDGKRYEIIAGELHVTPVPSPFHQMVVGNLLGALRPFVEEHGLGWVCLGPIGVLLAEDDYVEPDLIFIRRERMGIVGERWIEGPPDLVVEVVSDVTAERDRGIKRECYSRHGVPECWVVDREACRAEVHRTTQGAVESLVSAGALRWQPLPGGPVLAISVAEVIRGFDERD